MSSPYHFDRSPSYSFRRAPDYQRNRPLGIEGQVTAEHLYVGLPPFAHGYCANHSDSWNALSTPPVTGNAYTAWITSIANFLALGDPNSQPQSDLDYVLKYEPLSSSYTPLRYRTWHLLAYCGLAATPDIPVYEHVITIGQHTSASARFFNAGTVVYEYLYAYNSVSSQWETYTYHLTDQGVESTSGPTSGFTSPANTVSHAMSAWPGAFTETSGSRSANVYPQGAIFYETINAPGATPASVTNEYILELGDGWSFADLQAELDMLLAQIDLTSPHAHYVIDGISRTLNSAGESVLVTHIGPSVPDADGTRHPVQIVITSLQAPWNWATVGASGCIVAQWLNDIVNTVGPSGIDPAMNEQDVLNNYADNAGGTGKPWTMIKSAVRPPSGTLTKQISSYGVITNPTYQVIPDTTVGYIDDTGNFVIPSPTNADSGGELISVSNLPVAATGSLLVFNRGDWITITKLLPPAASIDQDGNRIDQSGASIDR